MATTSIEWTDKTWNPVTGCNAISPGCTNCYAEILSYRLKAMGQVKYKNGFEVTLHPGTLSDPLRWLDPAMIFVNSMSDLFHEDIPLGFIQDVFQTMCSAHWHTFQVLTKRSERLAELAGELPWPNNVWMGVSVEDQKRVYRIDHLRKVPAKVRFLSLEPLLTPLPDLDLTGIHQMIVGGESGAGARPMQAEWVEDLLAQARKAGVPFFFKQWGGVRKKTAGRKLNGEEYDELPVIG